MATRLKAPYFDAYFRADSRGHVLPVRFGVVTAYNPLGKRGTSAANRRRDAALRRHLDKLRIKRFRVVGGSKDGSHREPGWGVIAPRETVRALAALFEQDAYFWISSGNILLGSSLGGKLKPAGTWKARQASW